MKNKSHLNWLTNFLPTFRPSTVISGFKALSSFAYFWPFVLLMAANVFAATPSITPLPTSGQHYPLNLTVHANGSVYTYTCSGSPSIQNCPIFPNQSPDNSSDQSVTLEADGDCIQAYDQNGSGGTGLQCYSLTAGGGGGGSPLSLSITVAEAVSGAPEFPSGHTFTSGLSGINAIARPNSGHTLASCLLVNAGGMVSSGGLYYRTLSAAASYSDTVTCTDTSGNNNSQPVSFIISGGGSNLPPTVNISAPSSGQTFSAPASFPFKQPHPRPGELRSAE